ncbi:MAG: hypothetical protein AB1466_01565 [Actinomycetota bacterium]
MARRRMMDPNFWGNEKVAKWNFRQRLLFLGLVSNADDEGRLTGHPDFLRGTIFPYDNVKQTTIARDLEQLRLSGSIILYKNSNRSYIQITNWHKYQRINRPKPSKIPPPNHENFKNHSETRHEKNMIDSENLKKNSCLKRKERKEKEGEKEKEFRIADRRNESVTEAFGFEVSTQTLLAEFISSCRERPPKRFIGHLSREIKCALQERAPPVVLRRALQKLRRKGLSPATLPSLIFEIQNREEDVPKAWHHLRRYLQ